MSLAAPRRLVLASHNAGKLRELQALFDPQGTQLILEQPAALGLAEPAEPFHTFLENALHKARQAAQATGLPALADDSGLAVAALGGAPGVWSATYAGELAPLPGLAPGSAEPREARRQRQDAANIRALLQALDAVDAVEGRGTDPAPGVGVGFGAADPRSARFVCTLVAVRHAQDPEPLVAQGRWEGRILAAPRGTGGFGYDPVMWIDEAGATVAELGHEAKNSLSHRGRAAALMRQQMAQAWGWPL